MAVQVMNKAPISPFDTGARSVGEKTFHFFNDDGFITDHLWFSNWKR
jgi:hypothetical protein